MRKKSILKVGDFMREEYDIEALNPRKNPYAEKLRQVVSVNIDISSVDFFKNLAAETGIPYQTLINLYLADCAEKNRKINVSWT